jgi:Cu(I)/Ag(I) efflux system membrane fusion protein
MRKMKNHRVKIVVLFVLPCVFLILYSCKMKMEEKLTPDPPVDNQIMLSDAQIQLANINVAEAIEGEIGRKLSLTGVLKINEQSAITISSRVPGRIEKLFFKNTGESVKKGDKLYEFYSDDIVRTQREYYTLQSNNWNFSGRYEPSLALENKLLIMGLLPEQIKQLGVDGKILFVVTIYSPAAGKIKAVNVSEGQYVTEGQSMFDLAEDNTLWVEAQVYPDEIKFLQAGMPATVVVPAAGELPVSCKIAFINPSFETGKNVTLVRAVINNPDSRLHPGMFAIINVKTQISNGIIIPSSAVISGINGDVVWVRQEDGGFSGRNVTTGLQSGDSVLVISGLSSTDKIVTTGAYLLNSELILKQGTGTSGSTEFQQGNVGSDEIKTIEN